MGSPTAPLELILTEVVRHSDSVSLYICWLLLVDRDGLLFYLLGVILSLKYSYMYVVRFNPVAGIV